VESLGAQARYSPILDVGPDPGFAELTGVGQDYEAPDRPGLGRADGGVDVMGSAQRVVERVLVTVGG